MNEELKQKAENFIIDRYKIAECYREDNAETREYMRMDVHSQYEEEYQLYLDATKELQEQIEKTKKCLRGVVYMADSGLHSKNELAFARLIAEARDFLQGVRI